MKALRVAVVPCMAMLLAVTGCDAGVLGSSKTVTVTSTAPSDDPNSNDYVAMAVSITTGEGGYGRAGTQDQANKIAISYCETKHPKPCVIAQGAHHGCVTYAFNPQTLAFSGAQGPTADAAQKAAFSQMPSAQVVPAMCST